MKRVDLIKHLEGLDCRFVREGGSHAVYLNPANGQSSTHPPPSRDQRFSRSEKLS